MYITYDNAFDRELRSISEQHGGFAWFLPEAECEKRIQTVAGELNDSGLFQPPTVVRALWKQTYTPDEYYGFVLTGNAFIQKTEAERQAAYQDIKQLAQHHGGTIERPYLCVLYLAQKR